MLQYKRNMLTYEQITFKYSNHIIDILKQDDTYIPYFLTISFKSQMKTSRLNLREITTLTFSDLDRIYRHIISVITNNYIRKRHLYPLTFDFFDLPGSEHENGADLDHPELPHIHSIYLVHQETLPKFQSLIDEQFISITHHHRNVEPSYRYGIWQKPKEQSFPSLISIHAKKIEDVTTIPTVVGYAAKLFEDKRVQDMQEDCLFYSQNPKAQSEK